MKPVRLQSGFTLLEIMVVVVIIGLLTAMIAPQILGEADKAKMVRVKADITALENALERYKLDNHVYPSTEQGLEALAQRPSSPPEPRNYKEGGYIQRLPKDPWDGVYQYAFPGENGRKYDIYSFGADGQSGGDAEAADIGNWNLDQEKGQ
ncbi:MAG: type II secretion system major pseudopilin GspG [Gammaproteobacteria bacterium]|nr:type II secretion system major pseudopilin GspG [Gammaproteobacteria bacterium]